MLSKVVFAIECPGIQPFVFALPVVVAFEVVARRVVEIAVHALLVARFLVGQNWTKWCAYPFLE